MMRGLVMIAVVVPGCGGVDSSTRDTDVPLDVPDNHRTADVECPVERPTWEVEIPYTSTTEYPAASCTTHEECTDGVEGRCTTLSGRGGAYLQCTYSECTADDDCGDGVCRCADAGEQDHSTCLPAGDCQTDDDCGDQYCALSVTDCGPGWGLLGHFCTTTTDECRNDGDCGDSYDDYCGFNQEAQQWVCMDSICVG